MAATIPIGGRERLEEHQWRLLNDPQYLEDFLQATTIENNAGKIAENLQQLYMRYGYEEDISSYTDLLGIINKAHADAQYARRANVTGVCGWSAVRRSNPPLLAERAYDILRDSSRLVDELILMTYDEAMNVIEKFERKDNYASAITLSCLALQSARTKMEFALIFASIPILFVNTTIDALSPNSLRAKSLMKAENLCSKEHFVAYKNSLDEIFEHYS